MIEPLMKIIGYSFAVDDILRRAMTMEGKGVLFLVYHWECEGYRIVEVLTEYSAGTVMDRYWTWTC